MPTSSLRQTVMVPQLPEFRLCNDLLVLNPQRLSSKRLSDDGLLRQFSRLRDELPPLVGSEITVELQPRLSAWRGRLISRSERGTPVYAGSFIRRRAIVLEAELLRTPRLLRAILVHEIFHFVWVRLGNLARQRFSLVLRKEHSARARGELGESAGVGKAALPRHAPMENTRQWREYVCEAFCDTAAAIYVPGAVRLSPRLSQRWVERRHQWFTLGQRDGWLI